jgi:hypothetical protein
MPRFLLSGSTNTSSTEAQVLWRKVGEPSRSSPEMKPTVRPSDSATKRNVWLLEVRSARKRRITRSAPGAVA